MHDTVMQDIGITILHNTTKQYKGMCTHRATWSENLVCFDLCGSDTVKIRPSDEFAGDCSVSPMISCGNWPFLGGYGFGRILTASIHTFIALAFGI